MGGVVFVHTLVVLRFEREERECAEKTCEFAMILASSHGLWLDRDFLRRHNFLAVAIDDIVHHSPSPCIPVHYGLPAMFACNANGVC